MNKLPTGTVTFLFTDIEGSTRLWEQHPEAMRLALARHDALLRAAIETNGGHVFKTIGDAFCAAFAQAPDALAAALTAQRALADFGFRISDFGLGPTTDDRRLTTDQRQRAAEPLLSVDENPKSEIRNPKSEIRVRMALHTGAAELRDGDYFGPALNRVARLLDITHGGQVTLSAATRELVQDELPFGAALRDLGAHRLRDLQRAEHVFQLLHADLHADFPPLTSLEAMPNNLPLQVTSFIGREKEMAEVRRLLEMTRLLTLTGTGGTGKTRLALQIAAELLDGESDGVWLAELAALVEPALVPQVVAAVLGVREAEGAEGVWQGPGPGGRSLTSMMVEILKPKKLVLVLDNCEHLLEACAALAEALLRGCPGVQILTTSREGLNIAGETTYQLPSLSLPDVRALTPTAEGLTEYESVRLFIDRARAATTAFTLTDANAPAVAQVCHRLDGIPLALELAAARLKVLSVEQIAERLDDRFRLLTGGSRTALPRQQTLQALIDWSYDLLSERERALLRRLSVFAGGCTLAAAEAVCAGEGLRPQALGVREEPSDLRPKAQGLTPPLELWQVLDLLTSLVEKSLVLYEEREGEGRYRLLETVRQYARDRLLDAGEAERVRERHRDWFLSLAEEARPELRGHEQMVWLDRLEREHDNLRAAVAWSLSVGSRQSAVGSPGESDAEGSPGTSSRLPTAYCLLPTDPQVGLRLGAALWWFWYVRGYYQEGRERLVGLLGLPGAEARTSARVSALAGAGTLARLQAEYGVAQTFLDESLAIAREIGDQRGIASALTDLGLLASAKGDHGAARALFEESLAVFQALEDPRGIAVSLNNMGSVDCDQGEYVAGWPLLEESLAMARELRDQQGVAWSLQTLAFYAMEQGEYLSAQALYKESLVICRDLGLKKGIVQDLEGLAFVAVAQTQAERAARLLGTVEALSEAIGLSPPPRARAEHGRSVAAVRTALGEEAFAAAWVDGRAMPLEAAIAFALEEAIDA